MPRRTITLRGDAARAFIESQQGIAATSEEDALQRIATRVHMEVHGGNMKGAVAILQVLLKGGALSTADAAMKA